MTLTEGNFHRIERLPTLGMKTSKMTLSIEKKSYLWLVMKYCNWMHPKRDVLLGKEKIIHLCPFSSDAYNLLGGLLARFNNSSSSMSGWLINGVNLRQVYLLISTLD